MALVKAGWWQTTWWPSQWWHEDWWLEYGTAVAAVERGGVGVRKPLLQLKRAVQSFKFMGLRKFYAEQSYPFLGLRQLRGAKRFRWKAVGSIVPLVHEYFEKAKRDEVNMSFARWPTRQACIIEQESLGHNNKDACDICDPIGERAAKGTLFKAITTAPVRVVSKSDSDEIVVVGWGSYELKDPENDVITTQGQVKALWKWFNQVPEDYRHVHYKHSNFIAGKPLLSWKAPDGKTYHSHVNEKGTIIVAKVRPDDGLRLTKELRQKIRNGEISMFSIAADPLNWEVKMEKGVMVKYHYDLDPIEYTFCEKGINPRAKFEHVYEGSKVIKTDVVTKKVEQRGDKWCVIHCTGPDAGKPIKCFPTKEQAEAMHGAIQSKKSIDKMTIEEVKQRLLELYRQRDKIHEQRESRYPKQDHKLDWVYAEIQALESALGQLMLVTKEKGPLTKDELFDSLLRKHGLKKPS